MSKQEILKIRSAVKRAFKLFEPPTDLTVSQWADEKRVLSAEASSESGKFYTNRAEYQRGIMDAFSDPSVEDIVIMSSAQIGKTEILNNIAGFFIDQDPSPMLVLQPTVDMAQAYSKDRLATMIRDNPCLESKVKDPKAKDSGNTILHKTFPGGHITIVGANSPSSLASRPIRIVLCDEVDRYPESAGTEGDPINLAKKRNTTFWNKKNALFSTPTIKGLSRIENAYEQSDKRKYYVKCPHCNFEQTLIWGQVKWEDNEPLTAYYECGKCSAKLNDTDKIKMVKNGRWLADNPFTGVAGFHLNELYSPWRKFSDTVKDFLDSKEDTEKLKTWVNTALGETWEEQGESISDGEIRNRQEKYEAQVPKGGVVLTCGVDVQQDRLELETVAWGTGEESWSVDYRVIYGNPDQKDVWVALDDYRASTFTHSSGAKLSISATCIDSGGSNTQAVYEYGKTRFNQGVYVIKGVGGKGLPIVGVPNRSKLAKQKRPIKLFPIGVDQAKSTIYGRLRIEEHGSGYMHFPDFYEKSYFEMLTAEKLITKYVRGFQKQEWAKIRARNEALDCRVYSYAALKILNPSFEKIKARLIDSGIESKLSKLKMQLENDKGFKRQSQTKRKGSWASSWNN